MHHVCMPDSPGPVPADPQATDRLPHAWALALAGLVTLVAGGLCFLLGQATITALHGNGLPALCGTDAACLAALSSPRSELSGAPVPVWAQPVQLSLLWLLWSGRRADERGRRARGGAVLLAVLLAMGSLVAVGAAAAAGGLACRPCLALLGLHLVLLGLVLLPPGGRRPDLPLVDDWMVVFVLGLTSVMGFGFSARIQAWRLDHPLLPGAVAGPAEVPEDVEGLVEVGPVMLPAPSAPAPIDDQDPSVGPLRASVTAVAFLDLQDPASRHVAWTLMQLEPRYRDRVRFVTKHLPMDASCNAHRRRTAHPRSCDVAIALQCASLQGAFEGYRLALLRDPDHVAEADLVRTAGDLGLDLDAWQACRTGDQGPKAVEADIKQAEQGPLGDPPWVFIEGRVFRGEVGVDVIEAALAVALKERVLGLDGQTVAMLPAPPTDLPSAGPVPAAQVGGLWIDGVEDALDDQGRAVPVAGARPWSVDLNQARSACAAAGRHLCSRVEWATACQGQAPVDENGDGDPFDDRRSGRLRPYGDAFQAGWCGDSTTAPQSTGVHAGCRTPEGAWDMAGNMGEWVDDGVIMGVSGTRDACDAAWSPPGPGWRSPTTGFRCCADRAAAATDGAPAPPPHLPVDALPPEIRQAAGPGPVVVVPWTLACAPCQQALVAASRGAGTADPAVVALSLDDDAAGAEAWLSRSGMDVVGLPDPQAVLAGRLGVPGLPWVGYYDATGRRLPGHLAAAPEGTSNPVAEPAGSP